MSKRPTYQGIFLQLHLDEANGFNDTSSARRLVSNNGQVAIDPFDSPFEDPDTGFAVGCANWPQDPPPGGTNDLNSITVSCGDLLSWQDESFTIEFWYKFVLLPAENQELTISSMGGNTGDFGWELVLNRSHELEFRWTDINGLTRSNKFELEPDLFKVQEWQHFAFSYSYIAESFDYWIDGISKGPFIGLGDRGAPWSGVNILQTNDATNALTIGNEHGADRPSSNIFRGFMAEYRLVSGVVVYPFGEDFTLRTSPFLDEDPIDGGEEEIVINPVLVNGLPKVYVESSRHFPKLCQLRTENPNKVSGIGNSEGELYFQRPDPQQNFVFLWINVNINAENEAPVYRWVPMSSVQKGVINPETGNPWRSRGGNKLGEPF